MFIGISFPTKTIKNAENLGVNFWKVAQKKFSGQKKYIDQVEIEIHMMVSWIDILPPT